MLVGAIRLLRAISVRRSYRQVRCRGNVVTDLGAKIFPPSTTVITSIAQLRRAAGTLNAALLSHVPLVSILKWPIIGAHLSPMWTKKVGAPKIYAVTRSTVRADGASGANAMEKDVERVGRIAAVTKSRQIRREAAQPVRHRRRRRGRALYRHVRWNKQRN
jgi:hypothetical protein